MVDSPKVKEWATKLEAAVKAVHTAEGGVTAAKVAAGRVVYERPDGVTLAQVAEQLPVRKVRGSEQPQFSVGELSKWATVWVEYISTEGANLSIRQIRPLSLDKLFFWRPSATKLPVKQILTLIAKPGTPRQPTVEDVPEDSRAAKAAQERAAKQAAKQGGKQGKRKASKGAKAAKQPEPADDSAPITKGDWHKVMVTADLFSTLASLRDTNKQAFPRLDAVIESLLGLAAAAAHAEATGEAEALTKALAGMPKGTRQALRSLL